MGSGDSAPTAAPAWGLMNEVEIDRRDTASRPETSPSEHPLLARHHAHDGVLFKGRHTTLQLREDGLTGSYADIGTLIPGFDPGIEWFSMIWGDYHDNILAMQLDEAVMGPLPRVPHAGIVPLGEYVDGLKEYRLDGPIAERLQMEFPERNFYRYGAATGVVREVYFHDNCGWRVTPVH